MALDHSSLGLENNNLLACFFLFLFFSLIETRETMYKTILQRNCLFNFSPTTGERPGVVNMLSNVADEQHQFHFSNT